MDSIPFIVSIHYFVHISQLIICFKRRYLCTHLQRKTTYDINYKKKEFINTIFPFIIEEKQKYLPATHFPLWGP